MRSKSTSEVDSVCLKLIQCLNNMLVKMVPVLVLLLLSIVTLSGAQGLLLRPIDGAIVDCNDPFYISCSQVRNGGIDIFLGGL